VVTDTSTTDLFVVATGVDSGVGSGKFFQEIQKLKSLRLGFAGVDGGDMAGTLPLSLGLGFMSVGFRDQSWRCRVRVQGLYIGSDLGIRGKDLRSMM
jgi:hypothetical protein